MALISRGFQHDTFFEDSYLYMALLVHVPCYDLSNIDTDVYSR